MSRPFGQDRNGDLTHRSDAGVCGKLLAAREPIAVVACCDVCTNVNTGGVCALSGTKSKIRSTCRKHGIDFNDAIDVFNHPVLTAVDQREDYSEDRWIALGWMAAIVGVVVYVERNTDVIRVISAGKATKREVKRYKHSVWN